MPGSPTKPYVVRDLKARLMRPALTSHYICKFDPPESVNKWMSGRFRSGFPGENYYDSTTQELIELSCSEASLPGSSLSTNEVNDDYTGVTQKLAYRRLYDNTADFTFYVDRDYKVINFFEGWLSYITKEEYSIQGNSVIDNNYSYRVRFPNTYRSRNLYIIKFEKDTGRPEVRQSLQYRFIGAYPISINSMPVSYDQSQLLKCTVSFTYDRYLMTRINGFRQSPEPAPQNSAGVPNTDVTLYGPRPTDIPRTVQLDPNRPTLAQLYE